MNICYCTCWGQSDLSEKYIWHSIKRYWSLSKFIFFLLEDLMPIASKPKLSWQTVYQTYKGLSSLSQMIKTLHYSKIKSSIIYTWQIKELTYYPSPQLLSFKSTWRHQSSPKQKEVAFITNCRIFPLSCKSPQRKIQVFNWKGVSYGIIRCRGGNKRTTHLNRQSTQFQCILHIIQATRSVKFSQLLET